MHHAQLRAQSLDVVFDIRLQRFEIETMLMQGVQDLFFKGVALNFRLDLWLLAVAFEGVDELAKVLASEIGDGLERAGLEVLETGVIEDLAYRAL